MRKIILTIFIAFLPTLFLGQSALDKFDDQEDVTSVVVTKKMFELMSGMAIDTTDKDAQQYQNLIKKLENLKVYSTSSSKATSDMRTAYTKYLKSTGLQELIRITDSGKSIKIAVKSAAGDNKIKEFLMFMEGNPNEEPTVLLSLTGNFDLNEISALTDKMKIPGSEELKNATGQKL